MLLFAWPSGIQDTCVFAAVKPSRRHNTFVHAHGYVFLRPDAMHVAGLDILQNTTLPHHSCNSCTCRKVSFWFVLYRCFQIPEMPTAVWRTRPTQCARISIWPDVILARTQNAKVFASYHVAPSCSPRITSTHDVPLIRFAPILYIPRFSFNLTPWYRNSFRDVHSSRYSISICSLNSFWGSVLREGYSFIPPPPLGGGHPIHSIQCTAIPSNASQFKFQAGQFNSIQFIDVSFIQFNLIQLEWRLNKNNSNVKAILM